MNRAGTILVVAAVAALPVVAQTTAPTAAGVGSSDTTTPRPPLTGTLWLDEDFSTYTSDEHWRSNPHGWQATAARWLNQGRIHIDRENTYNGHPTLRYDWWPGGKNACGKQHTIESRYRLPQTKEVWIEVVHKFAPTFNTNDTRSGGHCSVGEYKHILIWRDGTDTDDGNRWSLTNGTYGHERWSAHPSTDPQPTPSCSGIGWKCRLGYGGAGTANDQSKYRTAVPSSQYWDGQWHTYRFHIRLPSAKGQTTGLVEMWIDGVLVKRVTDEDFINRQGGWTDYLAFISLGSNSNSGVKVATETWWGHLRIWTSDPGW
jgi:hypothetical protein